jgi:phage/conjugal plasmid C-4 type zinc finger TraR family protein
MADMFDQAQEVDALFRRLALERAKKAETIGSFYCDGCGEEIPAARKKAVPDCRYCVECLRELEHRNRR